MIKHLVLALAVTSLSILPGCFNSKKTEVTEESTQPQATETTTTEAAAQPEDTATTTEEQK